MKSIASPSTNCCYLQKGMFYLRSQIPICNSRVRDETLKIRGQHLLTLAALHIYITSKFVQMI